MCTVLLSPGVNPISVNKYIYVYIMLVSEVRCGDLHCRVEGKHLFGLTKQNLNGCQLHSNEEIEVAVHK